MPPIPRPNLYQIILRSFPKYQAADLDGAAVFQALKKGPFFMPLKKSN
jgi:hypothetical protein